MQVKEKGKKGGAVGVINASDTHSGQYRKHAGAEAPVSTEGH